VLEEFAFAVGAAAAAVLLALLGLLGLKHLVRRADWEPW
jgi:hypothetical protein